MAAFVHAGILGMAMAGTVIAAVLGGANLAIIASCSVFQAARQSGSSGRKMHFASMAGFGAAARSAAADGRAGKTTSALTSAAYMIVFMVFPCSGPC